ncbi:transcriptional regulator, partial [Staphylococcus aureus]
MEYDVVLYPIALLRPSEEVNMAHVKASTKEIVRAQRGTTPIPIEKETEIIMDDNHRYQVAHH